MDSRLEPSWWALRLTFGLVPLLAGIDKFFNLLADWQAYLSPLARSVLPFSPAVFMGIVGVVEIVVGLMVLTKWTRLGAYIASVWLVCIAINLVLNGRYFDIAVRDLALAVGAFALAKLSEVREHSAERAGRTRSMTPAHA